MSRAYFSGRHNTAEKQSIGTVVHYFPCVGKKKISQGGRVKDGAKGSGGVIEGSGERE